MVNGNRAQIDVKWKIAYNYPFEKLGKIFPKA